MATLYPKAIWQPVANHSGTLSEHLGLCVHVQVGDGSCYSEFNNPASQASSTWQCMKDGTLYQFVDADVVAWTEMAGNPYYDSVETEGTPDEPFTLQQCQALAELIAWGHKQFGWPLQLVDHGQAGITTHAHYPSGEPDPAWGDHPCVPLDITEVLTRHGWKLLRDVGGDDEVASWSPDSGIITFDHPIAVTSPRIADTVHVGVVEATPDHRMYARYRLSDSYKAVQMADLKVNARLPESGFVAEGGLDISYDLLRMLVWVQADGHYMMGRSGFEGIEFHLSKPRKIDRIADLCETLGFQHTVRARGNGTTVIRLYGIDRLRSDILRWLPDKTWTWEFLSMNGRQYEAFFEELMQADGYAAGSLYRSSAKVNLDVVQALAHLHGQRATFDRSGRADGLKITSGRKGAPATRCVYGQSTDERERGIPPQPVRPARREVEVGCLTTVNDTVLIRQHGHVSIVGNCPGPVRAGQLPAILATAVQLTNPPAPTEEDDMAPRVVTAVNPTTKQSAEYLAQPGLVMHIPDATCANWAYAHYNGGQGPLEPTPWEVILWLNNGQVPVGAP